MEPGSADHPFFKLMVIGQKGIAASDRVEFGGGKYYIAAQIRNINGPAVKRRIGFAGRPDDAVRSGKLEFSRLKRKRGLGNSGIIVVPPGDDEGADAREKLLLQCEDMIGQLFQVSRRFKELQAPRAIDQAYFGSQKLKLSRSNVLERVKGRHRSAAGLEQIDRAPPFWSSTKTADHTQKDHLLLRNFCHLFISNNNQ